MQHQHLSASEALEKLKRGNQRYLSATVNPGDISPQIRETTWREGQNPYAIIVTCSDSRVIPESIFTAGIGELFVIRVAGNVIADHQLGSIEYAAEHLGCKLAVILGHSSCGAIDAALHQEPAGYTRSITEEIHKAIGEEKDERKACRLNVERGVSIVKKALGGDDTFQICGAMYHADSGFVEFWEDENL